MHPKVSVMIMTYNRAALLKEAVESVLAQTYPDIRIVITDNGSTDGTCEMLESLAAHHPNIVALFSPRNMGISVNWNRGIAACEGKYTAILFDDDVMLPQRIEKQVAFLESHPEYAMVSHDVEVFDDVTGSALYRWSDRYDPMDGGLKQYLRTNWLLGRQIKCILGCFMFRTEYVKAFPFDERFPVTNEWLHSIDCLSSLPGKWGTLHEVLGRWRVHSRQTSSLPEFRNARYDELMSVLDLAVRRYPRYRNVFRRFRRYVKFQYLVFGWHHPSNEIEFEKDFRADAGYWRWLYMRAVRRMLTDSKLMDATRGLRRIFKAVVVR